MSQVLAVLGAIVMIVALGLVVMVLAGGLLAAVVLDVRDRWRAWRYYRRCERKEWWRGLC